MKRKILVTKDGSSTINLPEWNESYHSKHGAITEAKHVFITNGLHHYVTQNTPKKISILEIGFGTALNSFITLLEAEKLNIFVEYVGVDNFPIAIAKIKKLNYTSQLQVAEKEHLFHAMHQSDWEKKLDLTNYFQLEKRQQDFKNIKAENQFNIIYFDAFGARVQPELWTEEMFAKMYLALKNEGVLVTYAAKGSVRRAMLKNGFTVERLAGPPGKREMLRATKE